MRSLRKIIKKLNSRENQRKLNSQENQRKLKKDSSKSEKDFLDARYWDEIFNSYPKYATLYLDLHRSENRVGVELELNAINISTNDDLPFIIRLRIDTDNYIHNNLVIVDDLTKEIIRYEPYTEDENIDTSIKHFIYLFLDRNKYRDYKYIEIFGKHKDKQCVARCIVTALQYISEETLNSDIKQCCKIIETIYGELEGVPEIEYGRQEVLPGALAGGLGGAVIGGIVGGPAGAVGGLALGGIAGAGLGYLY